jgi:hypothetical protein
VLVETGGTPPGLDDRGYQEGMAHASESPDLAAPTEEEVSGTNEARDLATEDGGEPIFLDAGADAGADEACTAGCHTVAATGYSKWAAHVVRGPGEHRCKHRSQLPTLVLDRPGW